LKFAGNGSEGTYKGQLGMSFTGTLIRDSRRRCDTLRRARFHRRNDAEPAAGRWRHDFDFFFGACGFVPVLSLSTGILHTRSAPALRLPMGHIAATSTGRPVAHSGARCATWQSWTPPGWSATTNPNDRLPTSHAFATLALSVPSVAAKGMPEEAAGLFTATQDHSGQPQHQLPPAQERV
jgi:hypothetical protein